MPGGKKEVSSVITYLKDYKKLTARSEDLPLGTKVAYFVWDKSSGIAQFRKGGYVLINDPMSENVGLVSGAATWFVNRKTAKFWVHIEPDMSAEDARKFDAQIKRLSDITQTAVKRKPVTKRKPRK